jgi:hypothetical protein
MGRFLILLQQTVLFVLFGGQSVNTDGNGGVCMPLFTNPVNEDSLQIFQMTQRTWVFKDWKIIVRSFVTVNGSASFLGSGARWGRNHLIVRQNELLIVWRGIFGRAFEAARVGRRGKLGITIQQRLFVIRLDSCSHIVPEGRKTLD